MAERDTIYDISSIPYFPLSPGILEWCLLAVIFSITALLILKIRSQRLPSKSKLLLEVSSDIQKLLSSNDVNLQLVEQIRFRILRALALLNSTNYAALTAADLRILANKCEDPSLSKLLHALAQVEDIRFSGQGEVQNLIDRLRESLKVLSGLIQLEAKR